MAEKVIKVRVDKMGAQRDLKSINSALKDAGVNAEVFQGGTTGAKNSLSNMIPIARSAATAVTAVSSAVTAATAATIAFARSQALAIKELQTSARLAGLSTQQFQAYSYAANSFGVSQEKLGYILKDVNDRVGEFIAEGGGEFEFIFERVLKPLGLTNDELSRMSSAEILGAVQKGLDAVNANAQETTTVYERLANDATLLQPLLENNAEALNRLAREAEDMGLIISPDQAQAANDFNAAFERTAGKVSTFAKLLTAEMAPALTELVDLAGDFVTYMAEAFNLTIESQIESVTSKIDEQREALEKLKETGKSGNTYGALANAPQGTQEMVIENNIALLEAELEALQADLKARKELTRVGIAGGDSGGSGGSGGSIITGGGLGGPIDDTEAKELERRKKFLQSWVENIETYNMSATELNDHWRQSEIEKAQEWFELNKEKTEEYRQAVNEINKKWATNDTKIKTDEQKKQDAIDKKAKDAEIKRNRETFGILADSARVFAGEQSGIYKTMFAVQQAYNLATTQSDSIAAVAKAWNSAPFPANLPAVATTTIETGLLQSAISSISPSRQVGGYMSSNTPYQIGGGAHTTDPEIYSSGGKDYLVDSSAGKMTRLDKSSSSATGAVSFQLINNGSPVDAQVTSDSVDEQGVRRIVAEMTPQIMSKEMGNKYSPANQARKRWEEPQESYS